MTSCSKKKESTQALNPLLGQFQTPFKVPPFNEIKANHFSLAFDTLLAEEKQAIEKIASNPAAPTFENTVEALEQARIKLNNTFDVFDCLFSADALPEYQKIAEKYLPIQTKHNDELFQNSQLFSRFQTLYQQKDTLSLNTEQQRLLEIYHRDFIKKGAALDDAGKETLKKINEELSLLQLKFDQNVLDENNRNGLLITDQADLEGLPETIISQAEQVAKSAGHEKGWLFTLNRSSLYSFLKNSSKRELREKLFNSYTSRGNHNDQFDNKEICQKIINLRNQKSHLLGFENFSQLSLEDKMAKSPDKVYDLLQKLWDPLLKKAQAESSILQDYIKKEGHDFQLMPWDWFYYLEKVKKEKFNLSSSNISAYFEVNNVRNGAFNVASNLFGISFHPRTDIPVYNPNIQVFEVKDSDGSHIGILMLDYFARPTKNDGAWMSAFRKQYRLNNESVTPIVYNCCNFTPPAGNSPALLNIDEVLTVFHEFGHALHGLLSDCTYYKLSGTEVARDFVELPSQIMENWALEPEVLKTYAFHYQTKETIPQDIIDKLMDIRRFNVGYESVEYLSACFLDMAWHTQDNPENIANVNDFEQDIMNKIQLIPEIVVRYRNTYFKHIFGGGYASGYYSYIWSELLDADAFSVFKNTQLFNKEMGMAFRKYILSKGNSEDPAELYRQFKGNDPSIEALLKRKAITN